MPNAKRSNYKGYCITTRWTDLHLADRRQGQGFNAAFAVRLIAPDGDSWQEFPKAIFGSQEAAEANALDAARKSIDAFGSAPPRWWLQ